MHNKRNNYIVFVFTNKNVEIQRAQNAQGESFLMGFVKKPHLDLTSHQ